MMISPERARRAAARALVLAALAVTPLGAFATPEPLGVTSFGACRDAATPEDKVTTCSAVVRISANRHVLEAARDIRGLAYLKLGEFGKAATDFTALIALNPKASAYWDNREAAYRLDGHLREALKDANVAVGLAPDFAFVYRGRGNVYKDLGDFDRALADFDKAVSLTPNDGPVYIDRGKLYRQAGRNDDAIADFTHALTFGRRWRDALKERGLTYKLAGKTPLALSDLRDYIKTDPADAVALQALQELGDKVDFPAPAAPAPAVQGARAPTPPATPSPPPQPAEPLAAPAPHVEAPAPPAAVEPMSRTEVALHEDHGTFVVPVTLNSQLTLDFTVDSGASDVVVSQDVFRKLLRANSISSVDLMDERTYELADGSTIRSQRFYIHSLRVGDRQLKQVEASVTPSNGSLLLGQTFLTRFRSWSFDNQRKMLLLQ